MRQLGNAISGLEDMWSFVFQNVLTLCFLLNSM